MELLHSKNKNAKGERLFQLLLVLILFALYLHLASVLPTEQAPDEEMRFDLARWIYENGRLPIGNEEEIVNPIWGFSYAYNPYLPSMLAGLFMRGAGALGAGDHGLLIAARMVSVLSVCGSVCLCFMTGKYVFKRKSSSYIWGILVGLWPQVVFLSAYHNNDAFSLFSCFLILYFLLSGRAENWSVKRCIGLGFAISLCLLTYYYAYGWILVSIVFCIIDCVTKKRSTESLLFILRRCCLVAAVVLVLAGWYFIRNLIIHNDLLGMTASREFKNVYALTHEVHWAEPACQNGWSFWEMLCHSDWIHNTVKSYIGKFGYMTTELSNQVYIIFFCWIVLASLFGIWRFSRRGGDRLLCGALAATIIIPIIVSLVGSYVIDYQPQGRYIISSLPGVSCFVIVGWEQVILLFDSLVKGKQLALYSVGSLQDRKKMLFSVAPTTFFTNAITLVLIVSLGVYAYCGVMLKKLVPQDEINVTVAEDCGTMDITFSTSQESNGMYFVVCCQGFLEDGQWLDATLGEDGVWRRTVNLSDYNSSGTYTIHIYRLLNEGELIFAGETTTYVKKAVRRDLVQPNYAEETIYMYPVELYSAVEFSVFEPNKTEAVVVTATYDEQLQCWVAKYPFERDNRCTILAYACMNDITLFVGGT